MAPPNSRSRTARVDRIRPYWIDAIIGSDPDGNNPWPGAASEPSAGAENHSCAEDIDDALRFGELLAPMADVNFFLDQSIAPEPRQDDDFDAVAKVIRAETYEHQRDNYRRLLNAHSEGLRKLEKERDKAEKKRKWLRIFAPNPGSRPSPPFISNRSMDELYEQKLDNWQRKNRAYEWWRPFLEDADDGFAELKRQVQRQREELDETRRRQDRDLRKALNADIAALLRKLLDRAEASLDSRRHFEAFLLLMFFDAAQRYLTNYVDGMEAISDVKGLRDNRLPDLIGRVFADKAAIEQGLAHAAACSVDEILLRPALADLHSAVKRVPEHEYTFFFPRAEEILDTTVSFEFDWPLGAAVAKADEGELTAFLDGKYVECEQAVARAGKVLQEMRPLRVKVVA